MVASNTNTKKFVGKGMSMSAFDVKNDFEKAFGIKLENATPDQVEFIANCGRHIRARCTLNTELVAWLNSVFPSIFAFYKDVKDARTGNVFKALNIMLRQKSSDTEIKLT